MNWVWFPGPTERKNVESIYAFVHQLTHVKTGLMDWDIGQWKRVQNRPKTLVLIHGRTITSRADRRDLQCTLAGKSESLSSSVYVGRNLVFPLGQMPPSAAGWSQADHGVLPGNIFSGLPNEQLVLSLYLLTDSFLPPPEFHHPLGLSKKGFLILKRSQPLCVKHPRGEAGSMMLESESSGFDPRLRHLGVSWTLPLRASTVRWIIAKIKQTGSWKGLGG